MKVNQSRFLIFFAAVVAFVLTQLASCSDSKFHISGKIEGAADSLFLLQRSDFNGRWITVDSARAVSNGKFKFAFEAPASPEVFRVALNSKYVYIPIDSTESITLTGTLKNYPASVNVEGSEAAVKMMQFEREVDKMSGAPADSLATFKRRVYATYIHNAHADQISFHALGKMIDGHLLFDPDNADDAKYFSAVATAFVQYRPDDPRTEALKQTALKAQQARNRALGRQTVIQAPGVAAIEITLPDVKGVERSLSELLATGRPTIVVFSDLTEKQSPAINRAIANIYNRGGVNVYQVCLDEDANAWREAAEALPWVCVRDPQARESIVAAQYNVSVLPAAFIYNSKGELVSQATSFADLEKKLAGI